MYFAPVSAAIAFDKALGLLWDRMQLRCSAVRGRAKMRIHDSLGLETPCDAIYRTLGLASGTPQPPYPCAGLSGMQEAILVRNM